MQVKFFMRHFSENPMGEFYNPKDVEEYMAYQYPDWEIKDVHVSDVYDENKKFMGYRTLFILTKNGEAKAKRA